MVDLEHAASGTYGPRRTKMSLAHKKTGNLKACRLWAIGSWRARSAVAHLAETPLLSDFPPSAKLENTE